MRFIVKACIEETLWTGGEGILYVMIFFGIGEVNFSTEDALFVATSLASSDSQKKVNLDSEFRCRDADDVETFEGEASSFMSSTSGFQKKNRSEMGFI